MDGGLNQLYLLIIKLRYIELQATNIYRLSDIWWIYFLNEHFGS